MRRILAASLLSSLALTAAAAAPKSANDAATLTTTTRPVSTGLTNPQLVYSKPVDIPASAISDAFPNPSRLVLKVNLDETGTPKDVQVLEPLTQDIDARVVAAVRQFRWRPAVLDNQTIPIDLKLIVQVQR